MNGCDPLVGSAHTEPKMIQMLVMNLARIEACRWLVLVSIIVGMAIGTTNSQNRTSARLTQASSPSGLNSEFLNRQVCIPQTTLPPFLNHRQYPL